MVAPSSPKPPARPGRRDPRWPEERALEAMAAAMRHLPVETDRAWARVWARLQPRPAPRWPLAAGLSLVAVVLALGPVTGVGAWTSPTLAAAQAPSPRAALVTPSVGRPEPRQAATDAPALHLPPTPAPLPPGQS